MKARCFNKQNPVYPYYGGRGIMVSEDWLTFDNFLKDMGEKPNRKATLDRIDNDGNYCKENCRWISIQEQQKNKRGNNEFVGIRFEGDRNRWRADIMNNGKRFFLGRFKEKADAEAVRVRAEKSFGYAI